MLKRSARWSKIATHQWICNHLIQQPSVGIQCCSNYCTSPSNRPSRFNPIKIQMISESLHKQIFKNSTNTEQEPRKEIINKSIEELKAHGLWGKKGSILPDVQLNLPTLLGDNIDEHFREISKRQVKPYVRLAGSLTKNPLPPMPQEWVMRSGWTRYDAKGGIDKVNYPREDAVVFDVEVCMSEGSLPTLAVAVSPKAWYSWCSPNLTEDHLVISSSTGTPKASLKDLISLENPTKGGQPRLVIGHNVSYDRSYVKEQYFIKGTKLRFLDTLSLHMCVSGLTTFQRSLWKASRSSKGSNSKEVREHNEKVKRKTGFATHHPWLDEGSPNSLADVYALYNDAGKKLDKSKRDVFVTGTIQDVRVQFQDLMLYCAKDVAATHEIFVKLLEEFCVRFPHPVTFAGMLEMGQAYLPVNQNWDRYLQESQESYQNLQQEMKLSLMHLANDACSLLNHENYKSDPWLWDLDWGCTQMRLKKETNSNEKGKKNKKECNSEKELGEKCTIVNESVEQKDIQSTSEDDGDEVAMRQRIQSVLETSKRLPKVKQHMTGYPNWYRELCPKARSPDWAPGPVQISSQVRVTPKLLRLTWDGYPLYHDLKHGWGFLVPKSQGDQEERSEMELEEEPKNKDTNGKKEKPNPKFPVKALLRMLSNSENSTLRKKECIHKDQSKINSQDTDDQTSEDESESEGAQHQSKLYKDVLVDGCHFYKLPHKDGFRFNVGNPLAKDFLSKMEDGTLKASGGAQADRILEINKFISFWRNAQKRINSQFVVGLEKNHLSQATTESELYDEDNFYGAILPRVITSGTVTRRAVEPTWLTASNAREDRVGSELKSMVQAPPGYHFVGADVDSQELWIAALLGDANFCGFHGCTAFGWMNLQGKKSNETDLHSKTASTVSISRDQAKVFNYGRIYGAGQTFAVRLLMQFNHRLGLMEAKEKAKTMYEATKGTRMFKLTEAGIEAMESVDLQPDRDNLIGYKTLRTLARRLNTNQELVTEDLTEGMQWTGGSESAMFNKLESIADSAQPKTPVLQCRITRALEPDSVNNEFLTSRVNWVVQSSAVDYLHLMLVSMRWLFEEYEIDGRFCISIHDEVRYLVNSEDRFRAALALQITNILTRSVFAYNVGMHDLPQSVAFFSAVDIDTVLRKEVTMDCKTPSNPHGLQKGYGISLGKIFKVIQRILALTS
ncbi:DNA polymerase subunit gamma-1-like [Anneissia japonica]|uniref:DNA polymerase subunit gamma-1-like n=1 Tax=Anneissia japonica TaxID=1529436 RepID=UPI00142571A3|nr:DNA polymerase subunit gamma-1-like [Anneissia japonica]XP_033097017.1 DNA polymerase subunit gamma-1-like [Anneissia japonica]